MILNYSIFCNQERFYIDDLLSGSTSSAETIKIIERLSVTLENKIFHLWKWWPNTFYVFSHLSSISFERTNLEINYDGC